MSRQPSDNPYAVPQSELQRSELPQAIPATYSAPTVGRRNSVFGWILMFCFNLPLAAFFGFGLSNRMGALGILTALVGLLLLTTVLFSRAERRFASCWLGGSVCVALSQFLPYLHISLGYFAVSLFNRPSLLGSPNGELIFHQGLLCTLLVGGGLLGVSLLLGALFYLAFVLPTGR